MHFHSNSLCSNISETKNKNESKRKQNYVGYFVSIYLNVVRTFYNVVTHLATEVFLWIKYFKKAEVNFQILAKAFIAIGKSKSGRKVIENVYDHEGYVRAKDSDYDIVRKYQKIAEAIKK